jgi:hypothetical protein
MAIRKESKILVYIDPIGNPNLKTLIMEVSEDGEVKLTCVTVHESKRSATLSWREVVKTLYQKDGQIKGSAGSGLGEIVKEPGQICFIFCEPGKARAGCYITFEDFRDAIAALNN